MVRSIKALIPELNIKTSVLLEELGDEDYLRIEPVAAVSEDESEFEQDSFVKS
jgi:hypothetical protein